MINDPEQPEWFNKMMNEEIANLRASGSLQPAGWNAGVERLKRRRDYWLTCKDDAMRNGNLCNAAGFDCRAAGLQDALNIIKALEEEKHSND